MVEFALVVPILLLLLAGGADLARAYFVGIQIADGARSAALYAANNPDTFTYNSSATNTAELQAIAQSNTGTAPLVCPTGDLTLTLGSQYPSSPIVSPDYYQPITLVCELPLLTPLLPSPVKIQTSVTVLIMP
ncbi:MAG: TadE/TadG family type IV pilus assembly protein [Candidatus Dormibacteria bacterium]